METSVALSSPQTVITFEEFQRAIIQHRQRVSDLGIWVLKNLPDAFQNLKGKDDLVRKFLDLHDYAKLIPRFCLGLWQLYGTDIMTLPPLERHNARQLILSVNKFDASLSIEFLESRNLTDTIEGRSIAKNLLDLEKLADSMDRYLHKNTSAEFGRMMIPASQYLSSPKLAVTARRIEAMLSSN